MSYVALYRKYRPKTFNEVYGQSAIVQTLKNQIMSNRVGHAYLFSGPRGTGKTSIAKIFAKAINCETPAKGSPCLQCKCCQTTAEELNVDIVEIDAASNNGVDNVRELIDESKYLPQYGKFKVYIIDEVHMLSSSAFNALLKTLEEPTPNTVFILATTEEYKVPATIASRCQRFQFKLITSEAIIEALQDILTKEGFNWENEALFHISKLAKGGLRDATSLLDQCITFLSDKNLSLQAVKDVFGEIQDTTITAMVDCISNRNIQLLFDIIQEQQDNGKNLSNICMSLYDYYKEEYFHNPDIDLVNYQRYMRILAELSEKMKYSNTRTVFEIEMIKMCTPQMETDYSSLYQRIQQLEDVVEKLSNGQNISYNKPPSINEDEFVIIRVNAHKRINTEIYDV